jgi:hypothetical protein
MTGKRPPPRDPLAVASLIGDIATNQVTLLHSRHVCFWEARKTC